MPRNPIRLDFRSVLFDFPEDIAAAVAESPLWIWSDSSDGQTARLELIEAISAAPRTARGTARDADGTLLIDASWILRPDGRVSFVGAAGTLAEACLRGRGEGTVRAVLAAAVLGCRKLDKQPGPGRISRQIRRWCARLASG